MSDEQDTAPRGSEATEGAATERGPTRFVVVDGDASISHEYEVLEGGVLTIEFTREHGRLIGSVVAEPATPTRQRTTLPSDAASRSPSAKGAAA